MSKVAEVVQKIDKSIQIFASDEVNINRFIPKGDGMISSEGNPRLASLKTLFLMPDL